MEVSQTLHGIAIITPTIRACSRRLTLWGRDERGTPSTTIPSTTTTLLLLLPTTVLTTTSIWIKELLRCHNRRQAKIWPDHIRASRGIRLVEVPRGSIGESQQSPDDGPAVPAAVWGRRSDSSCTGRTVP